MMKMMKYEVSLLGHKSEPSSLSYRSTFPPLEETTVTIKALKQNKYL